MEHNWFIAGLQGSFAGQAGIWKILVGLKIQQDFSARLWPGLEPQAF